jgi:hypothetical protein
MYLSQNRIARTLVARIDADGDVEFFSDVNSDA